MHTSWWKIHALQFHKWSKRRNIIPSHDVKRDDRARQFQHITGQPVNQIQHAGDNNIQQNIPILPEYIIMYEDIYGTSVSYLQGKTVCHKVQHVDHIIVPNFPKDILYRYNNNTLWCDTIHTNGIVFMNTIFWHIIFSMGCMIKNRKVKNIEDGIIQFNKIYLQRGFNITHILIVSFTHFGQKWLILASPSILYPRRNMYPILISSIGPSINVSDLPERPCLSDKFLNKW